MKTFTLSAAVLLLATPVLAAPPLGETLGEKTGVNAVLNIAPSTADFVSGAAVSGMFEIQASRLAAVRSDPATRAFAERIIADRTKMSGDLTPLAIAANVAVPTEMDGVHKALLRKLATLRGGDFTRAYQTHQATAHQQALSLFERYAKGGDNSGLKTFATAKLPMLREHETMADNRDK
jgi:putative membrane protein